MKGPPVNLLLLLWLGGPGRPGGHPPLAANTAVPHNAAQLQAVALGAAGSEGKNGFDSVIWLPFCSLSPARLSLPQKKAQFRLL
jgi:hypothetical protein